jgi:hypothetical protein
MTGANQPDQNGFEKDPTDLLLYNLLINTDHYSAENRRRRVVTQSREWTKPDGKELVETLKSKARQEDRGAHPEEADVRSSSPCGDQWRPEASYTFPAILPKKQTRRAQKIAADWEPLLKSKTT